MDGWKKDGRRDVMITDLDTLIPQDHLLRKIEKVMDYDWLYERLSPYYCADNGRPGTDPVVLIKMVLIQHLYGMNREAPFIITSPIPFSIVVRIWGQEIPAQKSLGHPD